MRVHFWSFGVMLGTQGVVIRPLIVDFRPLRVNFRPLGVDVRLEKLIFDLCDLFLGSGVEMYFKFGVLGLIG